MWPISLVVGLSYVVAEAAVIFGAYKAANTATSRSTNGVGEVICWVMAALCAMSAVVMPLYWIGAITWETLK